MATTDDLRASLRFRLGEAAADVWTDAELNNYLWAGMQALYPYYFLHRVGTTVASGGPVQSTPPGAKNIYQVGVVPLTGTRVRPVRGWTEGDEDAIVPRLNLTGLTLTWSWTEGWDAPSSATEVLTIPTESQAMVICRAQISALERVLTNRTKREKYFAVQVREGVTEQDVLDAIDALHQSMRELSERAAPLPVPVK